MAQVQNANHLIYVVAINRQAGVLACRNRGFYCGIVIIEINTNYFVVRHHDIIDRDFFQVENAKQHLSVAR